MLCQAGRLLGLQDLANRSETRVLPSLVGSKSGGHRSDGSFDGGPVTAEPSLTINHPIGAGFRAEATINPDFSQIESDPAQLDANTTYALSLPERRPFFQEGSDLLETPLRTMYTRSINAPIGAVKLTRRGNRSGLLVLGARDQQAPMLLPMEERSRLLEAGRSVSSLVRWRRDLGGSSYVGTALTGRRLDQGGSSATLGIDGRKRFGTRFAARWQTTLSRTREPVDSALSAPVDGRRFGDAGLTSGFDGEEFFGHAGFLELERASRHWDTELSYEAVSPSFRAPLGFVNRSAYRELSIHQAAIRHPSSSWISRIRPYLDGGRSWNFDGVRKEQWIRPGIVVQGIGQTYMHVAAKRIDELFRGTEFGGLWRIRGVLNTRPTRSLEAGLGGRLGAMIARSGSVPRRGVGTELQGRAELRFTRRLRAAFRIQYSELHAPEDGTRFFEGFILRSRWEYQFTPDLSVRTILEYDEFGGTYRFEPLLRYEPAPFTRIYVGSSHGFAGSGTAATRSAIPLQRQAQDLFFKVQYGFRF